MGPIALSPVCDITTSINRGTFATDMYVENRLGESVGIVYRNGVNVLIPPMKKGGVANGLFEIYVHYRCQGGALLNQFAGFFEKNPKFFKVEGSELNDTSLKMVYRVTKEDLVDGDVFYIDELDLTLVLNPTYGMSGHVRASMEEKAYACVRDILQGQPSTVKIGVPYRAENVWVVMGGAPLKLPAFYNPSGYIARVTREHDGVLDTEVLSLDSRFVMPDSDEGKGEVTEVTDAIAASRNDSKLHYDGFFDRIGSSGGGVDVGRRDIGKELTNMSDAVEKVRANQRAEELARIKHAQAMAGESLKAISAASNLGAKILEVMP